MEKMKSFGEAMEERKKERKRKRYQEGAEGAGKAMSSRSGGEGLQRGLESVAKQIVMSRKNKEKDKKNAAKGIAENEKMEKKKKLSMTA